jgi:RNA-directed DNA polymerase
MRDTITGTPQGGILSPLLANIALGVLDEHLAGRQTTTRAQRRRGQPSIRLIRYADDWVVLSAAPGRTPRRSGTRQPQR